MVFRHPSEDIEFEIPNAWLRRANTASFQRTAESFATTSTPEWPTVHVSIEAVLAPARDSGVEGLREERTVSILQAVVAGVPIPPLEVHQPPHSNRLVVRDGFHRYFISIALGYPMLPVSIRPYFDFYAL